MNQVPVVHDVDDDNIIGEDNNVGIMKANSSIPVDTHTHTYSHRYVLLTCTHVLMCTHSQHERTFLISVVLILCMHVVVIL